MKLRRMVSAATAGLLVLGLSVAVTTPAQAIAETSAPGSYNPVSPFRVLDTRSGIPNPSAKAVAPLGSITFAIPAGASVGEILLEVTVVSPTADGYATVYPAGTAQPVVSNINFAAKQTVPNMVVVKVGSGNQVTIFNGSRGTINLLADVNGYFRSGTNAGDPGTLVPLTATRFLDTRNGLGAPKAKVAPFSTTTLKVAGRGGVPANATAVAVNLAAVRVVSGGFLTAFPGTTRPEASTVNFGALENRANLAFVELAQDGTISIFNGSPGAIDLLADVSGYFVGGGTPVADGSFVPSSNFRVIDTRHLANSTHLPLPGLATGRFQIFEPGDPFQSFIQAIAVNVTAVNPFGAGFFTTWDGSTDAPPAVSNVNFGVGGASAGSIVVPVNADGTISIFNGSLGNVDVIIDFDGLFYKQFVPTIGRQQSTHQAAPTTAQILSHIAHNSTTAPTIIRSH